MIEKAPELILTKDSRTEELRYIEDLKKYVAQKKKEQRDFSKYLKISNSNGRQAQILYWIQKDHTRFLTVKEIETIFFITNQTARTDLEGLVDLGFLTKIAVDKKSSHYWKSDDFDELSS